jgi:glutamine amidotransferase-like uncharacterized protein
MRNFGLIFVNFIAVVALSSAQTKPEGFYKHLFMDGGVALTSRTTLPAADSLNYLWEFLATSSEARQESVMVASIDDENGVLLYPDNTPRFVLFYSNGGKATDHGTSLGETGRERVRNFYWNGGSYTGTCAGAFLASISQSSTGVNSAYYGIWPGRTLATGLLDSSTGMFIEAGSPLLGYSDFGGDMYIADVRHNGGCYTSTTNFPPETEILLRYDFPAKSMHTKPSCWAYKGSQQTGRIVAIGSHPEGVESGERHDLMKAIFKYAEAGVGVPAVKTDLKNNIPRSMINNCVKGFEKLGDYQYHHFTFTVPEGAQFLKVSVEGESGYPFNLYARNGGFAFNSLVASGHKDISGASSKTVIIDSPASGVWYLAVELDTTVVSTQSGVYTIYSGALKVLDGLPYTITASYNSVIPEQYSIVASAGSHGSISPSGAIAVYHGGSQVFTVKPDSAYEVDYLMINGERINGVLSYSFDDISASATIDVQFRERVFFDTFIVDNGNPGTSSTGAWANSTGADYYGTQSSYTGRTILPAGTYTWAAKIQEPGEYSIEMWWTVATSRLGEIPVVVFDGNTPVDTAFIDQKVNGGKWNMIIPSAIFLSDSIKISIIHTGIADSSVCADAVRIIGNPRTISGNTSIRTADVSESSSSGKIAISVGPNPFNPMAKVSYFLPGKTDVSLAVYNMRGMKISQLVKSSSATAGRYTVVWDGRNSNGVHVSSGMYLFKLDANGRSVVYRSTLLR